VFPSSVTLQPSTQYFVYGDTSISNLTGGNPVSGETSYYAFTPTSGFTNNGDVSANFQVSGTAVTTTSTPGPGTSIPEPVTSLLVLPALAWMLRQACRKPAGSPK
jgi:hypothetical protein